MHLFGFVFDIFWVSGRTMLRACAYRGVSDIQTDFGVREKEEEKVVALGGYRWSAMSLSFTADIHSFAQHSLLQNTHFLKITHFILTQRQLIILQNIPVE
jgi:hypothetical protein